MISHIKTSKKNKELVTQLTNKFNLGAENVIARIALGYSIAQDELLDIDNMENSGGKEYSKAVLFGDYFDVYVGLICVKYGLQKEDRDVPKLLKMHLDEGLDLIKNLEIKTIPDLSRNNH